MHFDTGGFSVGFRASPSAAVGEPGPRAGAPATQRRRAVAAPGGRSRAGLLRPGGAERPHLAPTHGRRRGRARGKEGARAAAVAANGRSESFG